MQGVVTADLEAVISLTVGGPSGHPTEIQGVIDTGFSGFLTVPASLIAELGLPFINASRVFLADGSEARLDVHGGLVFWDDEWRFVRVFASDATPLVGMRMLVSYDLSIQVREDGRVVIQAGE